MRRWARHGRPALAAILATALAVGVAPFVGAHDTHGPDIKVALVAAGRCGTPADSLPVIVAKAGARPGDVVGDVTVCVTSRGDPLLTVLSLRAVELVDLDSACTGGEAAADTTCGAGRRGELSSSLLHRIGLGSCPSVADARLVPRRRLSELAGSSLLLALMRRSELLCVRIQLRYDPSDGTATVASQSDRTTWRYAFSLTGFGDFDD